MADPIRNGSLVQGLERDALHARELVDALKALKQALDEEAIPFAVVGALAMREHGFTRFTEDIDILTTREGLDRIHERLVGRGWVSRGQGVRTRLRDTIHKVDIDVLQAGEHAGSTESPIVFPDPRSEAFTVREPGVRYPTLQTMLILKLASGIWGLRGTDLGDVEKLISANRLEPDFADGLPGELRATFTGLTAKVRRAKEIEDQQAP